MGPRPRSGGVGLAPACACGASSGDQWVSHPRPGVGLRARTRRGSPDGRFVARLVCFFRAQRRRRSTCQRKTVFAGHEHGCGDRGHLGCGVQIGDAVFPPRHLRRFWCGGGFGRAGRLGRSHGDECLWHPVRSNLGHHASACGRLHAAGLASGLQRSRGFDIGGLGHGRHDRAARHPHWPLWLLHLV